MKIKKSKETEPSATGQIGAEGDPPKWTGAIKFRSKVPGVMITQYVETLPEGKTTPDFIRKPIALTIKEGKLAIFKAIVIGEPKPEVQWKRAKGDISDPEKFQSKFDPVTNEHTLEMPSVSSDDADTYKCYARNEFGKAVTTVMLNIIEVGFKKKKELAKSAEESKKQDPSDLRKMLRKGKKAKTEKKEGEIDEDVWDILMSAEKKDYERICFEHNITDFRGMLKKLTEMKRVREEEQAQFIEHLANLKQIKMKSEDCAEFELDMELKDPNSQIFVYKDGVMVAFTKELDGDAKHGLKQVGKKFIFSVKNMRPEDAGLYQVDVGGVNVFATDLKLPPIEFVVKLQEVKALERQDALFECVLSMPSPEITWSLKSTPLEDNDKFEITVSDDKLIHRLLIKDCMAVDAGIYAAIAGLKSCSAWLIVEADKSGKGKKKERVAGVAGGAGADLAKIAADQQEKVKRDMEAAMEAAKKAQEERLLADLAAAEGADAAAKQRALERAAAAEKAAREAAEQAAKDAAERAARESEDAAAAAKAALEAALAAANRPGATKEEIEAAEALSRAAAEATARAAAEAAARAAAEAAAKAAEAEGEGEAVARKRVRDGPLVPDTIIGKSQSNTTNSEKDAGGKARDRSRTKEGPLIPDTVVGGYGNRANLRGEGADAGAGSVADGTGEAEGSAAPGTRSGRARQGPLLEETVIDPGVHFTAGLEDIKANVGDPAELSCKLSSEDAEGKWYHDGEEIIEPCEGITITKEGALHKLKIHSVSDEFAGRYKFEADGRKTESMIAVEDPPRFDPKDLEIFSTPIVIKSGQRPQFKIPFFGLEPLKVQWYHEGEELKSDSNLKIDTEEGFSRLMFTSKMLRKDTGEIKIRIKNEFGYVEAFTKLIVLDKPTPPLGPLEIIKANSDCIEIKWRSPKDDGGSPITNYILERNQIGRNTWKKLGQIPGEAYYKDVDVDHGRKYCYRIRAETVEGISEKMETEDVQAGTKAYPGAPSTPKVVEAFKDCINLAWIPPSNTGGSNILGYMLEKRKKGSNLWGQVNKSDELIKGKAYSVKDVVEGMEYEFRICAINISGAGEFSAPSDFVFARDPKKPPGKVLDLRVTDSTYTTLSLSWTAPKEEKGVQDEAKGYFVDIRPAESTEWDRCNSNHVIMSSFTVKGMKSMAMYWVRVIAANDGGEGEPQDLDNYVLAMPPPVRPRFTDQKIKSIMVIQAGNSARYNINFEASPWPEVIWLKDGVPVSKRVTISNAPTASQILIPSSERSDSGIYTIVVKNIVGQETFSVEIRVTDEPKPPGPVEIDENVPGTVTVSWTASPDEKRDDRLHYMVTKRDSTKRTWQTVGDRIFNNKFTVSNIMPGREYSFRVYAKNDMGISPPSDSPKWFISCKKEKFSLNMTETKSCNMDRPPKFLVPLKTHTAPQGYECYMSCAIRGDPTPHVTWYRNNVSLNTNTNYYISNTCGVCSLLILRVGPKDTGDYTIIAENPLGRVECSTKLTVRD